MRIDPSQHDYEIVASLRIAIRRFLRETQRVAKKHALTPQRYDLLAIIRGSGSPSGVSISELADKLSLAAHSVTELVDRAAEVGLVQRIDDPADGRIALVQLTREGQQRLDRVLKSLYPERQALNDLVERVERLNDSARRSTP